MYEIMSCQSKMAITLQWQQCCDHLSFHAGKKQVNKTPRKASLDFSSQKQSLFVSVSVTQAQRVSEAVG